MSTIYVDRVHRPEPVAPAGKRCNNRTARRNDYPGEGSSRLSNEQKAAICIHARAAFIKVHGREPADAATLEAWRRDEQQRATGKPSLTVCIQSDYNALLSHFADLAGETGVAMNAEAKDATAPRRVAMHKLEEVCRATGRHISYPAAICKNQFKCALAEATAAQIWRLVFTVKNRGKGKGGAAKSEVGSQKSEAKPPTSDLRPPTSVPPGFKKVGGMLFEIKGAKRVPPIDEPF